MGGPPGVQPFCLFLLPGQAVPVHMLVNFGRRPGMMAISVHRASRCYGIAVVAAPNRLRRETTIFGPRAAREHRANHDTGRKADTPPPGHGTSAKEMMLEFIATATYCRPSTA